MIPQEFLYFIQDENYNCYYANGESIMKTAKGSPLVFSPDGWQEVSIQNQRNSKYFALDRSFTIPLSFVEDGAQIIKTLYYTQGIEAKLFLTIARRELYIDQTHYGFYYKLFYRGELDLSTFKHDGPKITCNVMEGGLPKLIKAHENTKYELDLTESVKVKMDGIVLNFKTQFTSFDAVYQAKANPPFNDSDIFTSWLSFYKTSVEGNELGVVINNMINFQFEGVPNYATDDNYFLRAVEPVVLDMDFNFQFNVKKTTLGNDGYARIQLIRSSGQIVHQFINLDLNAGSFNQDYNITTSIGVSLQADERLFLVVALFIATGAGGSDPATTTLTMKECNSSIQYKYRHRTTYIQALQGHTLFHKIIRKMSDSKYSPFPSSIMTENRNVVFTSGDALRGLTGAKIKTSLSDFFGAVNAVFGVGLGMKGDQLRLEEKSYWVDPTDVVDLGSVAKLKVSNATEYIINTIKTGYVEQTYDDVNGRDEFNNTHNYTTPITRVQKELNLVSQYRADCYGIEFTRFNLDGKTTTDNSGDNDVFMIAVNPIPKQDPVEGTYYELDRTLNQGTTGLIEPLSVFNLFLTPKRNLLRNGSFVRSHFFKVDNGKIVFQTTEKNSAVVSGGVTERAEVEIASLDSPLFVPILFEFETETPANLVELLEQSPMKVLQFTYKGETYKAIPVKVGIEPSSRQAQTFTALALPTNDFTKLIGIYE